MRARRPTSRWSRPTSRFVLIGFCAWLPFVVIAAIERIAGAPIERLLFDLAVHIRLLLAVPLFLAGDALLAERTNGTIERVSTQAICSDPIQLAALEHVRARRGRRLGGADLMLLGLAILLGQLQLWAPRILPGPFGAGLLAGAQHGAAALYYGFVAFPLFVFLGARVLYHWLLWAWLLVRLSRLPLTIEPAHPDRSGGLGLLARPTIAMALLVFANTAVFAAAWGGRVERGQAMASGLGQVFAVWLAAWLILGLGPLVAFFGRLSRARRIGLGDYDRLALFYVRRFHQRWLTPDPGPDLLGTADLQSLNDLGGSYRVVDTMRPLPFSLREPLELAIAAGLPMIPLLAAQVPLTKLLLKAVGALLGGF